MAVVYVDIYDKDDPNGSILVTLDDSDFTIARGEAEAWAIEPEENGLGSGVFTIRRDHPDATEANLQAGNWCKVRIPQIQAEPVFGFWIDEHRDSLIAADEEGSEVLMRGGPGALFILRHALLLDDFHVLTQHSRGSYDVPGYWTWRNEPYGAILQRLLEEGRVEPGTPLVEVTDDFTRQDDSDSNAWPTTTDTFQLPIGTDGLSAYGSLIESGEVFVRASPDLLVQAFGTRGVDRTSAVFASGKVRFLKNVEPANEGNILTGLDRQGHGTLAATHALVIGSDGTYEQVVDPAYSSGIGRWVPVDYPESDDSSLLSKVGLENIRLRNAEQNGLTFEFLAGNDPLNGRYYPFLHFNVGDLVTLATGTGPWDYNDEPYHIVSFKIVLTEATDDATDELESRSLRWAVSLGSGVTSGVLGRGDTASKGCNCLRLCHDEVVAPAEGALYGWGDNGVTWYVNGTLVSDMTSGSHETLRAIVDGLLVPGDNVVAAYIENGIEPIGWEFGNPTGLKTRVYLGPDDSGPAIANTSTSTKTWLVSDIGGTIDGLPANWNEASFDDSGWDGAEAVGSVPFGGFTLDGTWPPTAPSVWIAPPGSTVGTFDRGLIWLARMNFTTGATTGIFGGPDAISGDSSRAAPCDHHHAYTSAQISHDGGTVEDALDSVADAAPGDATYLVGTAHADLSAEIVVGATPGGELGNTWASPTIDASHSGSTHAATQAAAEATAAGALTAHTGDTSDAHDASAVSILDAGGFYAGADVEAALQELAGPLDPDAVRDAGRWEIVMAPGVTSPPDPVQTPAGDDWVYGWVPG